MSTTKPASQLRIEEEERWMRFHQLATYPEARAEAIATHYLSMANAARDLNEIAKYGRVWPKKENHIELEAMILAEFERAHRIDLGIALAWPLEWRGGWEIRGRTLRKFTE